MPDAESFVAAIASAPADDLPRLVFADWLDENGDPARAAFIRDHVALARLRPGTDEYKTLFRRCADTLKANLPAWIQPACDAFGQPTEWKPGKAVGGRFAIMVNKPADKPLFRFEFSRGFMEAASLDLSGGKDVRPLDRVLREYPVDRLTLWLGLGEPPWADHITERFQTIRTLTVAGPVGFRAAEVLFNCPHTVGVRRLRVDSEFGTMIENLCRSPMAKRLAELRVPCDQVVIEALREFPLDDRLQHLSVVPTAASSAGQLLSRYFASQPASGEELWPALSRVAFRPTLKRLDLTRCGMTDDGLAAFARGEEWVRLQGLKLGGNLFGDRGWADFCRGWRTPELTYLDASRNRLTDAGAEMLSRSGMVRTLRVIDLRGNRIAGRGAVALARAVAEGKVNKLLLAGNPVGKREAATVKGLLGERVDLANGAT